MWLPKWSFYYDYCKQPEYNTVDLLFITLNKTCFLTWAFREEPFASVPYHCLFYLFQTIFISNIIEPCREKTTFLSMRSASLFSLYG